MRKLTNQELILRQTGLNKQPKMPFTIILNDIRSLYNVGSIYRTADGAGAEKIWLCGITGYPPQAQICKTALGAEDNVPWEYHQDALEIIRQLKTKGYQIILLEQTETSIPYEEFVPDFPLCLVVGNEITGISDELVSLCDAAIELEMSGVKNSLNVSVALGIIAYHFRYCFKKQLMFA